MLRVFHREKKRTNSITGKSEINSYLFSDSFLLVSKIILSSIFIFFNQLKILWKNYAK